LGQGARGVSDLGDLGVTECKPVIIEDTWGVEACRTLIAIQTLYTLSAFVV